MVDKNGKVLQYNSVERRHEYYHKLSHKIIKKEKEKKKLSKLSCRTLNKDKYLDFIHSWSVP